MVRSTSGTSLISRIAWAPPRRRPRLHVFISSSFAEDAAHLREKTIRIGFLCRALAIFRVDRLVIYHEEPEKPNKKNAELIRVIADYLNTAPYLRKRLFKIRRELKYAGLLPPLNIPTHPQSRLPPEGLYELREGLVLSSGGSCLIEAGLPKPIKLHRPIRDRSRVVLLTMRKSNKIRYRLIAKRKLEAYLGFQTRIHDGRLDELVKGYPYSIATSRYGEDFRRNIDTLRETFKGGSDGPVCVAFGSYKRGLKEIADAQGFKLGEVFDSVLNFIPDQAVRTVRTEEAIYAVLSILNTL